MNFIQEPTIRTYPSRNPLRTENIQPRAIECMCIKVTPYYQVPTISLNWNYTNFKYNILLQYFVVLKISLVVPCDEASLYLASAYIKHNDYLRPFSIASRRTYVHKLNQLVEYTIMYFLKLGTVSKAYDTIYINLELWCSLCAPEPIVR